MNENDALKSAVVTIVGNTKVAAGVGITTATMGLAEFMAVFNSMLGTIAMIIGIVASIFAVRVSLVNYRLTKKKLSILEDDDK